MPWIKRVNHTCPVPVAPLRDADRGSTWACSAPGCDRTYIIVDHSLGGDQTAVWGEARYLASSDPHEIGSYVLDTTKSERFFGEPFGDFDD